MKRIFLFLCLVTTSIVFAQNKKTIYFDHNRVKTTEENAAYFGEMIEHNEYTDFTIYSVKTGNVICKQQLKSQDERSPIGLQENYYEDGQLRDSIFYTDSIVLYSYHYYPDGRLRARYVSNENPRKVILEGFDENGKKIRNYILWKKAEFRGPRNNLEKYIEKRMPEYFPEIGRMDTVVSTIIGFTIDERGILKDAEIAKSSGYEKVDKNALQIIRNSASWQNAIMFNEPVSTYQTYEFFYDLNGKPKMFRRKEPNYPGSRRKYPENVNDFIRGFVNGFFAESGYFILF